MLPKTLSDSGPRYCTALRETWVSHSTRSELTKRPIALPPTVSPTPVGGFPVFKSPDGGGSILSLACRQGGEEICKGLTERLLTYWVKSVWYVYAECGQMFSPGTLSVFSTAGRFSLMRKAKWGRQTCLMPWRRSQRNTTVSYRQTPQRTKYDGPGEPQPNPTRLFVCLFACFLFLLAAWSVETPQRVWFAVPLIATR